ncbi:peptidase S8/S53 domain-containing protein [Mycena capillaripes]|nr:peptidase S8/S53 domain-containing protein [Mycena capillaripes]
MPSRIIPRLSSPLALQPPLVNPALHEPESGITEVDSRETTIEDKPAQSHMPVLEPPPAQKHNDSLAALESLKPSPRQEATFSLLHPQKTALRGIAPHLFSYPELDLNHLAAVARRQRASTEKKLLLMEMNLSASRSKLAQLVGLCEEMGVAAACEGLVEECRETLDGDQTRIEVLRRELEGLPHSTFFSFFALLSLRVVSAGGRIIHESRPAAPSGFVSQGTAPADDLLTLRFALAPNNLTGLKTKFASIPTPGSPEFRKWLSKDEVKAFVKPSAETVAAFDAFASANGLKPTVISPNEDWVSLTLPVTTANKLFAANFELFTHPSSTQTFMRTLSVSLPSQLVGHVDVISQRDAPAASCNTSVASGVITPTCLQDLYGIPTAPATQPNNSLLVTAYIDEWAQSADLSMFLSILRPDIPATTTFTLLTTDGGSNPQGPLDDGIEANLDIQYTMGIATESVWELEIPAHRDTGGFLSVGGGFNITGFAQSLLDTTIFLDGIDNPPTVMTTSYGSAESDFGISMATKICNGYMALSARGISQLTGSGDGGVRGNHDSNSLCGNNGFSPVFPASCPFVTTVGATQGFGPEIAINFTGGGFSAFFPAPSYQSAAIAGFLETIPSNFTGIFNTSGRGFPDVSLQGLNFEMVTRGETILEFGTSASSPTFAGIIALINDHRLAAGKPVLGFLNPWLYSGIGSTAFNDITIVHNSGFVAFDAAQGWDPLSGWGSPKFAELLAAALA